MSKSTKNTLTSKAYDIRPTKVGQVLLATVCWPTFLGVLHDTRVGKVGQQNDNMADSDDEDALFAF